jgi:HTH-type transcriptional regulator/antitoxin HigA
MQVKPIRSEQDYEEALAEITMLFTAEQGSEDFDKLDVLTTLIDTYESRFYPILPPDPVSAIEYEAEKSGPTELSVGRVRR